MIKMILPRLTAVILILYLPGYFCQDCSLTQWSEWSACTREIQCENIPDTQAHQSSKETFKELRSSATSRSRISAERMATAMTKKQSHMDEIRDCQTTTCQQNGLWGDQGHISCNENTGFAGNKPCHNIDQVAFISTKSLMGGYFTFRDQSHAVITNDVWGWTDKQTNDEWAIVGLSHGTSFVKITDRNNPKVLAFIASRGSPSSWRDMKVVDDVVYIVSEASNHGLQYFDLHRLRVLDFFKLLPPDGVMKHHGSAHNIVANEEKKLLYVVGARFQGETCEGGLHVIDATDRLNPRFSGCYSADGYTHDAQCVIYHGNDTRYRGKNICFSFNEDTLTIVDVEDIKQAKAISVFGYSGSKYTHQGWLTESHNTVLIDDELDELDTNDNYTYQSNYADGLVMLHINEETYSLKEVAYFDVDPEHAAAEFRGSWSNYPYFASGVIPVTSIERGLFLVEPKWERINNQAESRSLSESAKGFSQRFRSYNYGTDSGPNEIDCSTAILVEKMSCVPDDCA